MGNFWLTADIDGRATTLSGGPVRKDGGMRIKIRQRDNGISVVAFQVNCYVDQDGKLVTEVRDRNGYAVKSDVFVTER